MTIPEGAPYTLLVSTVGGTAAPIAKSLLEARPEAVIFVCSRDTRATAGAALAAAASDGLALRPGQWRIVELADHQDFSKCVQRLRELDEDARRWQERGEGFRVVVDFTGGTKCMSAALALVAHRWRCDFAYVGGAERTKDGTGVVVTGTETVLNSQNPWDALGYQAAEDAMLLCDQGQYAAAVQFLDVARLRAGPAARRTLSTLTEFAKGYDAWDRFRHGPAQTSIANALANANDLRALLGRDVADELTRQIEAHQGWLAWLDQESPRSPDGERLPSRALALDLIANACRRGAEQRFDDAVARLYRAVEALAQAALYGRGIPKTGAVPPEAVPEPLRQEWAASARDGVLLLGLEDDYRLLAALGDPLAAQFEEQRLGVRKRSPLQARNNSILAHGFEAVNQKVYTQLRDATLALAGVTERDLPAFPRLSRPAER